MANTRELSQLASVISVADETRNVGIGTTDPTSKLHVSGDVRVSGVVTATSIVVGSGVTINTSGINASGIVTALGGVRGIGIYSGGNLVTTGIITALNFIGTGNTFVVTNNKIDISISGGSGGSQVSVGTESPASPSSGNLWYNTNLGRTFIYYNDGDSSQWVDAAPFNIVSDSSSAASVSIGTEAPVGPTSGDLWYNADYARIFVYYDNGINSQWVDAAPFNYADARSVYADNAGIATYASNAGIATFSTSAGIATYASNAGIATFSTSAGISTSVIGGIGSITQLQVTGISTFTNGPILVGTGTSTGTASQRLQVTGGAYVSGSVGIGTTNPGEKLQVDGNIRLGVSTTSNYLAFYGTTGDSPGSYSHTYIGERVWSTGTERSELLLFKGNDAEVSNGWDRIRLAASQVRIDTYTTATGGNTFENIATSANLINRVVVHSTGEVGIGTDALTGTASQPLQVSGGAYVSGSVGIGSTNPTSKLHVIGDVRVSGVVTATTFTGALTGTASSTTNIPNLTGAITSVGTATTLGSFTSAQLATALTDETGSGANVFATSPTLVTPALGTPSSGTLSGCTVDGTNLVGYKSIPAVGTKTASYTLVLGDVGKFVELGTGGTVVVPASVFSAGDAIMIFNNTSGSISCTCSAITTVYKGGTDADISTFSVTTRGVATFLFISATVAVVTGNLA